jgi:hypothetical protein
LLKNTNVSVSDNYFLWTNVVGDYTLFSAIQQETGPRSFYPFFGFAYMGNNAQIRVMVIKNSIYQVTYVYLYNYILLMEKERDRERQRETERDRERQRETERDRERDRVRQAEKDRYKQRHRGRVRDKMNAY